MHTSRGPSLYKSLLQIWPCAEGTHTNIISKTNSVSNILECYFGLRNDEIGYVVLVYIMCVAFGYAYLTFCGNLLR